MKDTDQIVDDIVSALREVEPSQGMERRILERLQAKGDVRMVSQWRPAALSFARLMGVVALSAVVASVGVVRMSRTAHAPSAARVQSPVRSQPGAVVRQPSETIKTQRVVSHRVRRSVVMDPSRMASFPAPPMPLTQQERLLIRIVRRGDPGSRAMLDPASQEMQLAKENDQFEDFFGKKIVRDKQ